MYMTVCCMAVCWVHTVHMAVWQRRQMYMVLPMCTCSTVVALMQWSMLMPRFAILDVMACMMAWPVQASCARVATGHIAAAHCRRAADLCYCHAQLRMRSRADAAATFHRLLR